MGDPGSRNGDRSRGDILVAGKKYLVVTTRELCYFSGSFFLERIAGALSEEGADVEFLYLSDGTSKGLTEGADFSLLESFEGQSFDGIIDINSKLPYLIADDDEPFLDKIDAPFFNIILDHPLYHHPGLSFKLKNYHAIAIDKFHKKYIEDYYPHIRSVKYLPIPGTKSACDIPISKRSIDVLFPGTLLSDALIDEELHRQGVNIYALSMALIEEWREGYGTMEEALKKIDITPFITTEEEEKYTFPEWMNRLYAVDRYMRNEKRKKAVFDFAKTSGRELTIMGEGWEETGIYDLKNVKKIEPRPMGDAIEIFGDSMTILYVNPLFSYGVHDRVTTGLINGCEVITDANPEALAEIPEGYDWRDYVSGGRFL